MSSEIASRHVSIYPRISSGFSTEINAAVQKGATQGGAQGGKIVSDGLSRPIKTSIPAAVSTGMEQGVRQGAPRMGAVFKSTVAPILTATAAVAVLKFVRTSVDAFNEYEDASSAAAATFGDSLGKVISITNKAAETMGMSKSSAIEAATGFGTFATSAGLAGDDAANFSTRMVQLSADLASFKGTSPEQAIEAVSAALRGEAEPIQQYGVLLNDAALRQQALKMGLIQTTKEALTPQQRVLAAQAEILAQTTRQQGDYNRTAGQGGNVQKTLAAQSADLSVEIGEKLQPAIVAAQRAGIGMIDWVVRNQAVIAPLAATVGTLTAAVAGFVVVGKGIEALKSARATINGLGDAYQAMGTKAKVATASAGAIGIALTAASVIYGYFAQKNADAEAAVSTLTSALEASNGALDENVRKTQVKILSDSGLLAQAQKYGVAADVITDAVMGNADAMDQVHQSTTAWLDAHRSQLTAWEQAGVSKFTSDVEAQNGALVKSQQAYTLQTSALKSSTASTARNASATTSATSATQSGTIAFSEYKKSIDSVYNANLKMRGDQRAVEAAIDDASAAAKKNGKTLDINTAKGRDNQAALDGIASAALSVADGMSDADVASGKAGRVMNDNRAEFIKAATAMGKSKKEAEELADKLGLIKSKKVIVEAEVKKTGVTSITLTKQKGGAGLSVRAAAHGGPIKGPGTRTSDSIPAWLSNDEHVLTADDVDNLGGHDGVFRMRSLAKSGALHFASGGPVAPSYKGHSLEWWQDYLLSDVDFTRLQIQIRDLKSSLSETETYNPPGSRKRAKRQKLRGLDRTEAQQELKDAAEKLALAKDAAAANSSAAGTIADQIAQYEAAQEQYESTVSIWQEAAASLSKSSGLGSMDSTSVKRTNTVGDVWYEKQNTTAADLASRVTEQAGQVETFIGLLDQLRKAGASEALISDVLSLGTVEGTKAARLFLADATQMAIANSAYARLESANSTLTAIGDSAATTTVNVTINEAVTTQATTQAVLNGILAGRS